MQQKIIMIMADSVTKGKLINMPECCKICNTYMRKLQKKPTKSIAKDFHNHLETVHLDELYE